MLPILLSRIPTPPLPLNTHFPLRFLALAQTLPILSPSPALRSFSFPFPFNPLPLPSLRPAVDGQVVVTSVLLFATAKYSPAPPVVLRGAILNRTCVNLPAPRAGAVGSLRILWSVKDGSSGASRVMCGKVVFWNQSDYSKSSSALEVPGGWKKADAAKTTYAATSK
ncbi:unnamed protein product [Closterium sp. NIES-53]